MKNKIDIKAILIGVIVYFIGSFIFPLAFTYFLVTIKFELVLLLSPIAELVLDLFLISIVILCAGYCTNTFSSNKNKLINSIIVGVLISLYNIVGTMTGINNYETHMFYINICFDLSIIILSCIGGIISKKLQYKKII
ncbi:hypothetical protein GCM10010918_50660 [Paenibacillus radicis (ex Gao et al. 2016)]|uniref:Uncharacterized protein n=1 Tax=Paenibacillus radicis (ex Gao et al. 2016) TaxID=1737354 RepID=A0A917HP93_9BACL|nr:hypothetical protein GCM10010918_50660 [Paenibacillus radicis (ex Gao et al. 2016)]